jgi:hypothetical protein
MMAALEDEIAAALKQVGAGAAGADIPALLESIMGAMASSASPGQGGGASSAVSLVLQEHANGDVLARGRDDEQYDNDRDWESCRWQRTRERQGRKAKSHCLLMPAYLCAGIN